MLAEGFELEQSRGVVTARISVPQVSHVQMQELVDECLHRLRMHGGSHVVLDLGPVEFLSSACLGPIVSLLQDLEHLRGRLAVCNCQDNVAFLFRVTRLDAAMGVFADEQAAMASL